MQRGRTIALVWSDQVVRQTGLVDGIELVGFLVGINFLQKGKFVDGKVTPEVFCGGLGTEFAVGGGRMREVGNVRSPIAINLKFSDH